MLTTRWQWLSEPHFAIRGQVFYLHEDTIINNLFQVKKKRRMESSSRSKRSWCCPKLPYFIHHFFPLSSLLYVQLLQSCTVDISHFDFLVPCFRLCTPIWLCWYQSLVLEVIFQRLGQGEALNLLQPVPTQRQAGCTSTQVHQRKRFSCGVGDTSTG